ncbi:MULTISPECIES: DUF262 domain-containing protein [Cupriavidus]
MDADELAALTAKIRPMPRSKWQADFGIRDMERTLSNFEADYGLNLEPDFQRGHVWTQAQQERYIEAVIRGAVSAATLLIQFNAPHWENHDYRGDLPCEMQCIDGLQRLSAVRAFAVDGIRAFGYLASELDHTPFSIRRAGNVMLKFAVHTFQTRAALLQFYLDLNAGGTPHAGSEIARVRRLLADAKTLRHNASVIVESPAP